MGLLVADLSLWQRMIVVLLSSKVSTDKKMEILPDGQVNASTSNLTTNAVVGINNFHDQARLSGH